MEHIKANSFHLIYTDMLGANVDTITQPWKRRSETVRTYCFVLPERGQDWCLASVVRFE